MACVFFIVRTVWVRVCTLIELVLYNRGVSVFTREGLMSGLL